VHYDLRLQFSKTSTISFAIPYGLPGDPNSLRPNRMAIETRVHNLWNNLVESASHSTGSLLIWDTGEYEVLPYRETRKVRTTDDELSDNDTQAEDAPRVSESEKLFAGFQSRHLRLRLRGTRLPRNYTISLRLPSGNDRSGQPEKPKRKRRKVHVNPSKVTRNTGASTNSEADTPENEPGLSTNHTDAQAEDAAAVASEAEDEDAAIRSNNAYTGATNTIGSIHQRHWYLSLDRKNSGFRKARSGIEEGRWIGGHDGFLVLGRDVERSVVSGRLADEAMSDEGVNRFQGRKMWRAITE